MSEFAQVSVFEGWAVVELLGHQREIGYVTTVFFGDKCMFRVDTPIVPEREIALNRSQWLSGRFVPAGATVTMAGRHGKSRFVGPGAIYAINPCTEEAARAELEAMPRELKLVSLPEGYTLASPEESDPEVETGEEGDYEEGDYDDGH